MSSFFNSIVKKIEDNIKTTGVKKKIILPESDDPRVLKALSELENKEWIDKVYTIGNKEKINNLCEQNNLVLNKTIIVDPDTDENFNTYANDFYEARKHKGITLEDAKQTIKDNVYYGAMLVKNNVVNGMVAGSIATTAKVLKASIHIIKLKENISKVSSSFAMIVPECDYGLDGKFLYADCGVVPSPEPEELADIAKTSADTFKNLFNAEPKVAFLSFSTLGSAHHPLIDRILEAVNIAKKKYPDLLLDGELQLDAAIVPSIAERKAKNSKVAGKANVLIFPDLNSGNIAYKLTERLARAEAYGPLVQGLAKPVNDLSRGCSVNDIVNVATITVSQCY